MQGIEWKKLVVTDQQACGVGFYGCVTAMLMSCDSVTAKPLGVNRPELLPQTETTVIDTANYLRFSAFCPYQHTVFSHLILNNRFCSKGQEKNIEAKIQQLESATGIKLRIVCQRLVCDFPAACCDQVVS
jgi:hypothetical protein